MNKILSGRMAALLMVALLAACSDKKAPSAVPAVTATASASASSSISSTSSTSTSTSTTAAPAPGTAGSTALPAGVTSHSKKVSLDCDDRAVVLEAVCSDLNGPRLLACTSQSLAVNQRPGGALKALRQFAPQPGADGDPPLVEEKVGALSCIQSGGAARYIVAEMYNGGNCEQCEWRDVYDWDGKLVASSRDRAKPAALVGELQAELQQHPDHLIGRKEIGNYNADTPQ